MTGEQIVASYGPSGPAGDGTDPYVADLLQRSVDGQWRIMQAQGSASDLYSRTYGVLILQTDLSTMSFLFTQRLALMRWMMATAFLDGVVVTYRSEASLPEDVYQAGDRLCDLARHASRRAVEAASQFKDGKVRLPSADSLTSLTLSVRWLGGTWGIFGVVASVFGRELTLWESQDIPARFKSLIDRELKQARPHLEAFRYLDAEWRSTQLSAGQADLVKEARPHIEALYVSLQRLWSPSLFGGEYGAALKRPLTLSEVSVRDPWILTDPKLRSAKQGNKADEQQLAEFWEACRDPAHVERLVETLTQLRKERRLRLRTGKGYGVVPWPSQFLVRRPFTVDGMSFSVGDLVVIYTKRASDGKFDASVRRTGRLTNVLDALGAAE